MTLYNEAFSVVPRDFIGTATAYEMFQSMWPTDESFIFYTIKNNIM